MPQTNRCPISLAQFQRYLNQRNAFETIVKHLAAIPNIANTSRSLCRSACDNDLIGHNVTDVGVIAAFSPSKYGSGIASQIDRIYPVVNQNLYHKITLPCADSEFASNAARLLKTPYTPKAYYQYRGMPSLPNPLIAGNRSSTRTGRTCRRCCRQAFRCLRCRARSVFCRRTRGPAPQRAHPPASAPKPRRYTR